MSAPGPAQARATGAANLCWGAALLLTGDLLWRDLTGRPATPDERRVIAVLGGRHAVQGALQLLAPARGPGLWALVDLSHAVSMVALAAVDRDRRQPALLSASVSVGSAAGSVVALRDVRRRAAARRVLRSVTRARRPARPGARRDQSPVGRSLSDSGPSVSQVVAIPPKPPDIR